MRGLRRAWAMGVGALLLPVAAAAVVYEEDFTGYDLGQICDANPGEGWWCTPKIDLERLDIANWGTPHDPVLWVHAEPNMPPTAPHACHSVGSTLPFPYAVTVRFNYLVTQLAATGAFAVLQLRDAQNREVLAVGYRDAVLDLDATDAAAPQGWRMNFYEPEPGRDDVTYSVVVHGGAAFGYSVVIREAGQVVDSEAGLGLNPAAGAAVALCLGSLSGIDRAAGLYDEILVET